MVLMWPYQITTYIVKYTCCRSGSVRVSGKYCVDVLLHAVANELKVGVWGKDDVYSNIDGGFPLVVFDKAMTKAMVLSPLNTLMSANQMRFTDSNTKDKMVTFGPLNTIDMVPLCLYNYNVMQ